VFGRLITSTGWTWEYVRDEFDLTGLRRMYRYWSEHPPVHELVAGYMGIGTPKKSKSKTTSNNLRDFASEMSAGFNGIKKTRPKKPPNAG
jgi:hypothetical protein